MKEKNLIEKAKHVGYQTGTTIEYNYNTGYDVLGSGEFALKDGKLIKYEKDLKYDNPSFRRFDTIWSEERGWVKIVILGKKFTKN